MSHLATLVKQFARDESGAALVEYAVIFAILIAGSVAVLTTIGADVAAVVTDIQDQLAAEGLDAGTLGGAN